MPCPRCLVDQQPENFGSPRRCAFNLDGQFQPNNWNCATIQALIEAGGDVGRLVELEGDDESLQIIPACARDKNGNPEGAFDATWGWVVLTRYKHRGCTSSAVWVGDWWPAVPLTLAVAEETIRRRCAVGP